MATTPVIFRIEPNSRECQEISAAIQRPASLDRPVPPRLSDAEAAKRLGITQPRVSRPITGKWQDFSLDMLLTLAARAGLKPELKLA